MIERREVLRAGVGALLFAGWPEQLNRPSSNLKLADSICETLGVNKTKILLAPPDVSGWFVHITQWHLPMTGPALDCLSSTGNINFLGMTLLSQLTSVSAAKELRKTYSDRVSPIFFEGLMDSKFDLVEPRNKTQDQELLNRLKNTQYRDEVLKALENAEHDLYLESLSTFYPDSISEAKQSILKWCREYAKILRSFDRANEGTCLEALHRLIDEISINASSARLLALEKVPFAPCERLEDHRFHADVLFGGDALGGGWLDQAASWRREDTSIQMMMKKRTSDQVILPIIHGGGHFFVDSVRRYAPKMGLIRYRTYPNYFREDD